MTAPDRGALAARVDALGRAAHALESRARGSTVPARARELAARATIRLELASEHTVAALAGATGAGKSSLFNAIAGIELSESGPLRPTTGEAHACIWGEGDAGPLLDWLGVDPRRRFVRESALDGEDEAALRGLILLDLPDVDSIAAGHRVEADRLVQVADVVVWVLDPQKYADAIIHESYLRHAGAMASAAMTDLTVVVLNQIDRLTPRDAARCRADLGELLDADGLGGVPVIATSAATRAGVDELRALLEKTVAGRPASLSKIDGQVEACVDTLAPMVAPGPLSDAAVGRDVVEGFGDRLAIAVGVAPMAAAATRAYAARTALPGWPFRRRARPPRPTMDRQPAPPADPTLVGTATRWLATRTSAGLPPPWPDEMRAALRPPADRLPRELAAAVEAARPRRPRAIGWLLAQVVWWLAIAAILAGAGALAWSRLDRDGLPSRLPSIGGLAAPVVAILTGVAIAILVPLLGRPLARFRARRYAARVDRRLRDAVADVARVEAEPARAVLRDHADAQAALRDAAR